MKHHKVAVAMVTETGTMTDASAAAFRRQNCGYAFVTSPAPAGSSHQGVAMIVSPRYASKIKHNDIKFIIPGRVMQVPFHLHSHKLLATVVYAPASIADKTMFEQKMLEFLPSLSSTQDGSYEVCHQRRGSGYHR